MILQELARVSNLSTVDVAAVRLWLDRKVQPETPSNVMVGFDEGVGATFFDLNTLQVWLASLPACLPVCTLAICMPILLSDAVLRSQGLHLPFLSCKY